MNKRALYILLATYAAGAIAIGAINHHSAEKSIVIEQNFPHEDWNTSDY